MTFLAHEWARFMAGAVIRVEGGYAAV